MTDENGTIDDESVGTANPSRRRLVVSCILLTISVAAVFPAFSWFGYSYHGKTGVLAALIAASVCWFASTAALILTCLMHGPNNAVTGMFLAMAVRTGLPLGVGIFLAQAIGGPLARAQVFGMILVYYLITLIVETILAIRLNDIRQAVH